MERDESVRSVHEWVCVHYNIHTYIYIYIVYKKIFCQIESSLGSLMKIHENEFENVGKPATDSPSIL